MPLLNGKVTWTAFLAMALLIACGSGSGGSGGTTTTPPPTQPTIQVAQTLTANVSGNLASVNATPGATYAWSLDNGTITAGANANAITFTTGAVGTLDLACKVTNAEGSATGSVTLKVVADSGQPVPPAIQAPATLVTGQGVETAQTQSQPNCTYAWTLTGGTLLAGQGTPVVTFDVPTSATAQLRADLAVGRAASDTATLQVKVTDNGTGDSSTSSVTLPETTVTTQAPSTLVYAANPVVFTVGQPALDTQTSAGGSATSYALSGALPTGLALDPATGFLQGTPTTRAAAAPVTITAANAAGSTTATVSVAVQDEIPAGLTYAYASATFTAGTPITPDQPSSSGGPVSLYAVAPALPAGLALDPGTGIISGTPAAATPAGTYTVTASNDNASATATAALTFTVNPNPSGPVPPTATLAPATLTVTAGHAWTFTANAGGTGPFTYQWNKTAQGATTIVQTGVSDTLSSGSAQASDEGTYTVTVTDQGTGLSTTSAPATLTVTPVPVPPTVSLAPATLTVTTGHAWTFTATAGGTGPFTYQWDQTVQGVTTVLTGAANTLSSPSAQASDAGTYTVTVTDQGTGLATSAAATLTVTSAPVPPTVSVAPAALTVVLGQPWTFTATAGGTGPFTYQWNHTAQGAATTVPTGASNTLSSQSAQASDAGTYTVTVTDQGTGLATTSAAATLTVTPAPVPPTVSVGPPFLVITLGQPWGFTATAGGTGPFTYQWNRLVQGVTSIVQTGASNTLSSPGAQASDAGTYTVTVLDQGTGLSVTSAAVTLSVLSVAPSGLSYGSPTLTLHARTALAPLFPTVQAGTPPFTYSAQNLPEGLVLDPATGALYGTPTFINVAPSGGTPATVTITATNAAGNAQATLALSVQGPLPIISYGSAPLVFPVGVASTFAPVLLGAPLAGGTGWQLSGGPQPAWLNFNAATGTFSGTPGPGDVTGTSPLSFTVMAASSGGTASAPLTLTVPGPVPILVYGDGNTPYTLTAGTPVTIAPTNLGGGTLSGWSVTPPLPSGMTLNQDGTLTGTPSTPTPAGNYGIRVPVPYTVTALFSGSQVTASVGILVEPPTVAPSLSYSATGVNLFPLNEPIAPMTPAAFQSAATYSVQPALPQGLTLDPGTGMLQGTPTLATNGLSYYTVTATSYDGCTLLYPLCLEVPSSTLFFRFAPGTAVTLTAANASGGAASFTADAAFPPYLTLDPVSGLITGTAPAAGTAPVTTTVTATDVRGATGLATLTLQWGYAPPVITYGTTPIDVFYGLKIGQSGPPVLYPSGIGGAPATWSAPTLPAGLLLDPTQGTVSGTPPIIDSQAFPVTVTNPSGTGDPNTATNTAQASLILNDFNAGDYTTPWGPYLTYSAGAIVLTVGQPAAICPSATTGSGALYSFPTQVDGNGNPVSLPAGMSLNPSTGVIAGTPTEPMNMTMLFIVNDSLGPDNIYEAVVNVQVVGAPPAPPISLTYGLNPIDFPIGSPAPAVTPVVTGGPATSFTLTSGTLPAWMSFTNGVFSGTAPAGPYTGVFTVQAANVSGSVSCSVTIRATAMAPAPGYGSNAFTLTVGTPFTLTPLNPGGPANQWTVVPQPPSTVGVPPWLQIDTATGVLSGTPTAQPLPGTPVPIIVYANSGALNGSTVLTLNVVDAAPIVSYGETSLVFTKDQPGSFPATVTAGDITQWSITPPLPPGLALDGSGTLAGVPTLASGQGLYTVTATNASGATTTVALSITVQDPAPVLDYPVFTYPQSLNGLVGMAMQITPVSTGGTVTAWSLTQGSLPPGLVLDSSSGALSGTPTLAGTFPCQITGTTASSLSGTLNLTLTITPTAPLVSYGSTALVFPLGRATTFTPVNQGGPVTAWAVTQGTLPTGLTLGANGALTSAANAPASAPQTVTLTATGADQSTTPVTLSVAVASLRPDIGYGNGTLVFPYGVPTTFTPTNHGSSDATWTTSPPFAQYFGLTFDPATGIIQGTLTADPGVLTYTVTATNGLGSSSTQVSIAYGTGAPAISYGAGPLVFPVGVATTVAPINTGGPLGSGSWGAGNLPAGVGIDPTTGILSGTLAAPIQAATVAVTFGGTTVATVTVQSPAAAPALSYGNGPMVFTWGVPTVFTPTITGGGVVAWSLAGTLPSCVTFDPTDGSFSGTGDTAGLMTGPSTCVLTAFNDLGSTNLEVMVSVAAGTPGFAYPTYLGSMLTFTLGTPITAMTPTVTGEPAVAWSCDQLPPGLNLDSTTGVLSGTPSAYFLPTYCNLTATFQDGATVTLPIQMVVPPMGAQAPTATVPPDPAPVVVGNGTTNTATLYSTISGYGLLQVQWLDLDRNVVESASYGTPGAWGTFVAPFTTPVRTIASGLSQYYLWVQDAYGNFASSVTYDYAGNIIAGLTTVSETLAPVSSSPAATLTFTNTNLPNSPTFAMALSAVPNGTFTMGSPNDSTAQPPFQVTITRPFYMMSAQMTMGLFGAIRNAAGYAASDGNLQNITAANMNDTATNIDFGDISYTDSGGSGLLLNLNSISGLSDTTVGGLLALLNSLPQLSQSGPYYGWTWRLPTEAEWEWACRAGTTTDLTWSAGGGVNGWGLSMPSAESDWVQDWFAAYPNPAQAQTDPVGPAGIDLATNVLIQDLAPPLPPNTHAVRGGPVSTSVLSSYRRELTGNPNEVPYAFFYAPDVGFRLVLAPPEAAPLFQ